MYAVSCRTVPEAPTVAVRYVCCSVSRLPGRYLFLRWCHWH